MATRVGPWLLAAVACMLPVRGQETSETNAPLEYQIKAAFLYNFAKFVEWPAEKLPEGNSPIVLCVVGKDPFAGALDQTLRDKTVNGHPFVERRLTSLGGLKSCHILFISPSENKRLGEILRALGHDAVLTVGEMGQFGERGGMINFTTEENRVRLEINPEAAARAGVRISSKLLKLARLVRSQAREP